MTIVIDSTTYNVPIISINRKVEPLFKFAERTEDLVLHSEIGGVFYNYDFVMGMNSNNVSDYAALFLKLSEPVNSHEITIPGAPSGYETATYYVPAFRDEVARYNKDGVDYFRNLSFSAIAISPARIPA